MIRIAEHWHGSDLGRQRRGNEDNYFVRAPLFVVADGMGGAQAGEVASEMAVESFDRGLPDDGSPAEGLVRLIEDANRRIHDRSREDADRAGMGTTVTAAHVGERDVTIAHVGDSRAYVLRDGELTRLTRDHSLVGELVARGKLTEEQAEAHPQRSVITRSVGPEPSVEVDVETFPARAGDVFLLCSDGLTGMVPEARLTPIITGAPSLAEAGRELIAAANEAGGRDNITVVLFRLEDVGGPGGAATDGVADQDTSQFETWAPGGGSGAAGPGTAAAPAALGQTRVRDEEALEAEQVRAAVRASDEAEAGRRRSRTYSPARPRDAPRRRRRRWVAPVLVVTALLAIVVGAFWAASRLVYFVGTDPHAGNAITIYQGLPYELPLGIRLYSRHAGSGVTLAEVPRARRRTFTDHKLRSLDDAESLVNALERGRLSP
jgi:PPM family protein phosphatase